ncbi:hypothetical protein SRABI106_04453 [Rahnella aquatilis]|nr:hypothetical protein SRABI106_04453 [Rahnella aquatilis]
MLPVSGIKNIIVDEIFINPLRTCHSPQVDLPAEYDVWRNHARQPVYRPDIAFQGIGDACRNLHIHIVVGKCFAQRLTNRNFIRWQETVFLAFAEIIRIHNIPGWYRMFRILLGLRHLQRLNKVGEAEFMAYRIGNNIRHITQ